MTPTLLRGKSFNLEISFPILQGKLVRIRLVDLNDQQVEEWFCPMSTEFMKYANLLPLAQKVFGEMRNEMQRVQEKT